MKKIKIIIADSNFLSRKGLALLINECSDFQLLDESKSTSEVIAMDDILDPDLIIIDYTSANFNIDSIALIKKKFPKSQLLAITLVQSNRIVARAFHLGVVSHLLKECDQDEIMEAIYKTAKGEKFVCGRIVEAILNGTKPTTISDYNCDGINVSEREMEVIKLIAEGLSNKEVADKLFLSTHTVTTHRKNIMAKLGLNNTAGLVLFAVRENLVSPEHFAYTSPN